MDRNSVTRRIGNVVVGTDFAHHSHDAVARAAWLPITSGSRVTLVHALPPNLPAKVERHLIGEATALMRAAEETFHAERSRSGESPLEVSVVIEPGRPAELLETQADNGRAELVVVGRGRRHGAAEHLLGSVAERALRICHTGVLVAASTPSETYQRPLVAVDYSEQSTHALEWALRLAGPPSLELLHAFDAPYVPLLGESGWSPSDIEDLLRHSEERAQAELSAYIAGLPEVGVQWTPGLFLGDPRRVIVREAEARQSDLVLLGTHGRIGVARFLLGSVAQAVVRAAHFDVLVAR